MKFVIEHLEDEVSEWVEIEYEQISKHVGKDNLIFTNVKNKEDQLKLKKFGEVVKDSVQVLHLQKPCVLDPESKQTLSPKDNNKFCHLIFGGILGDFPPRKRTEEELTRFVKADTRNMGKDQMSTDTAVLVAKTIVDGTDLNKIEFQEGLILETGVGEEVHLPYKYLVKDNKPVISKKLISYLRREDIF